MMIGKWNERLPEDKHQNQRGFPAIKAPKGAPVLVSDQLVGANSPTSVSVSPNLPNPLH